MKEQISLFSYCRVSTKQQLEDKTIEIQENIINRFVEFNKEKYEIIKYFKDEGISAFKDRPDYEKMLEQLFNNEADGIIIKELSRIGRSVKQLVNLMDRLDKNDKHLIVIDQNINTSTKEGRLFFHILAAIAQYEAELIKERTQEGIQRYVEEGGKLGRPKITEDPKIIKKIKKLYLKNKMGCTNISKFLRGEEPIIKMSPGTINNILHREGIILRDVKFRKKKNEKN